MAALTWILWVLFLLPLAYWLLLALASIRPARKLSLEGRTPRTRFALAIPAHDEESVIAATVQRLMSLDYPADLFKVCIVADHCGDQTAQRAREAGAVVFERNEGPRSGKGGALLWLFEQILQDPQVDAVVIFDADTLVDAPFLRVMDARFADGAKVVQGQHIIANPHQGWFPVLTWAMFLIDNRYQNLGRVNLGWSAKHMGDSIAFQADVLRRLGWGEGLTEDYQLRQNLLMEGTRIAYEPAAKGYGEAPLTWGQARAQRMRWLKGTQEANRGNAARLFKAALQQRSSALLDGVLQAVAPSFSSLSLFAAGWLVIQLLVNWAARRAVFPVPALIAWGVFILILFLYPLGGLALEKAPFKAYLAILSGPLFMVWRSLLALQMRFGKGPGQWVRTQHGQSRQNPSRQK